MANIDLIGIIKKEITRRRHPEARRNTTFYPSSAWITLPNGHTLGGCSRSDWYRIHNITPTNGSEFYMHFIWHLGKAVELKLIDAMKCAGIYENDGVKFYDREHNVSGELDIVGRYRDSSGTIRYYGVEAKSVYGQGSTETITGRSRAWRGQPAFSPYPKVSNLMQVAKYLWEFSMDQPEKYRLEFFKLLYVPRDKPVDGREYTVTMVTKDDLSGKLKTEYGSNMTDGHHYLLVTTVGHPDVVETRFSIEQMHANWKIQKDQFDSGKIPGRPHKKFYSAEDIERLKDFHYKNGGISKTVYQKWEKAGKPPASLAATPGHFLCQSYCDYRDFCYTKTGKPNKAADQVGLINIREDSNAKKKKDS